MKDPITDEAILETMETLGGSFVRALAQAYRLADNGNRSTLRQAFAALFEQYRAMAALRRTKS